MKLIIDVGNSYTKFAIFNNDKITKTFIKQTKNLSLTFLKKEKFDLCIFSSVVSSATKLIKKEINKVKVIDISSLNKKIVTKVNVKKEEIGNDLFADLIATKKLYKGPAIIIDIGTVTKVLALDKNNSFVGANFFTGLDTSKKALNNDTDALPNIDLKMQNKVIGKDTYECINNGIIFSLIYSIEGFIKEYKKILGKSSKVIFTGGGSLLIKNKFKKDIFNKYLTLLGVYYIYKENK